MVATVRKGSWEGESYRLVYGDGRWLMKDYVRSGAMPVVK